MRIYIYIYITNSHVLAGLLEKYFYQNFNGKQNHNILDNGMNFNDDEVDDNINIKFFHNDAADVSIIENVPILVVNGTE